MVGGPRWKEYRAGLEWFATIVLIQEVVRISGEVLIRIDNLQRSMVKRKCHVVTAAEIGTGESRRVSIRDVAASLSPFVQQVAESPLEQRFAGTPPGGQQRRATNLA